MPLSQSAIQRRLQGQGGFNDPRSTRGTLSRGTNVYGGGSNAAQGAGRPPVRNTGSTGNSQPGSAQARTNMLIPGAPAMAPPGRPQQPQQNAGMAQTGAAQGRIDTFIPQPPAMVPPATRPTQEATGPTGPMTNDLQRPSVPGAVPEASTQTPTAPAGNIAEPWENLSGQAAQSQQAIQDAIANGTPITDPIYDEILAEIDRAIAGLETSGTADTARIRDLYTQLQEQLERERALTLEGTEQGMADQGILFSGINTRQQGRVNEQFNAQQGAMSGEMAGSIDDLWRQITQQSSQLRIQQQLAMAEAAEREEERRQQQALIDAIAASQPQSTPTGQYRPGQTTQMGGTAPPQHNPGYEEILRLIGQDQSNMAEVSRGSISRRLTAPRR